MNGGQGLDFADYSDSNAAVSVNLATGAFSGGFATGDSAAGTDGIIGSNFNDTLVGFDGSSTDPNDAYTNIIYGGLGRDSISGLGGGDTLYGGNDADTVSGDLGNDRVFGDAGNDVLYGGEGTDTVFGGDDRANAGDRQRDSLNDAEADQSGDEHEEDHADEIAVEHGDRGRRRFCRARRLRRLLRRRGASDVLRADDRKNAFDAFARGPGPPSPGALPTPGSDGDQGLANPRAAPPRCAASR